MRLVLVLWFAAVVAAVGCEGGIELGNPVAAPADGAAYVGDASPPPTDEPLPDLAELVVDAHRARRDADATGNGRANGNGHANGNGNDHGDGNGNDHGDGNGYGDGHDDGDGDGNGNGHGDGHGDGNDPR